MDLQTEWIVGFVDGEGVFHISIKENEIIPEFAIIQHQQDVQVLHAMKAYFGCGVVRKCHNNRLAYQVRGIEQLMEHIVPFFEKHPLKTKKNLDFIWFRKVLIKITRREHLTFDGFEEIQKIEGKMNRSNLRYSPALLETKEIN